ncbi:hypothetical protein TELCIR_07589 [Teladorsagia circumcincta]|uniref:Uncharacterized protein n=1 Tax=Teladorsagia circumcincta TaxID=45464 RepID=A0A2G9UJY2_TELCI|nr:hypothetical protein TELCIR_07589 [Teladorsagia circumcincta]
MFTMTTYIEHEWLAAEARFITHQSNAMRDESPSVNFGRVDLFRSLLLRTNLSCVASAMTIDQTEKGFRRLTKSQPVGLKYIGIVLSVVEELVDSSGNVNELLVRASPLTEQNKPKAFVHWVSRPVTAELLDIFECDHKQPGKGVSQTDMLKTLLMTNRSDFLPEMTFLDRALMGGDFGIDR